MRKVLFVDDEEVIRKTFQFELLDAGYDVSLANDGESALELIKENEFDIVITDIMMEKMDGIILLDKIRQQSYDTIVIILTGFADFSYAIKALRLGADDYLLKPCKIDELLIRLQRAIEKHKAVEKLELYEDVIPMCSECGLIRDDEGLKKGSGKWKNPADYLADHSDSMITHTLCPLCYEKHLKDFNNIKK